MGTEDSKDLKGPNIHIYIYTYREREREALRALRAQRLDRQMDRQMEVDRWKETERDALWSTSTHRQTDTYVAKQNRQKHQGH